MDTSAAATTVDGLCRLRNRDGGVGDDDMYMDVSVGTETSDKDVRSNNGQEHADAAYIEDRVRSLESEISRLQKTMVRLTAVVQGGGASGSDRHNEGGKRKVPSEGDYGTPTPTSAALAAGVTPSLPFRSDGER